MSGDCKAKWVVFTILVGAVACGGWLPISFFIVAAFITAFLFAIKRSG